MNTRMIISCPKRADRVSFLVPSRVMVSMRFIRLTGSNSINSLLLRLIWKAIYSTIITAPSIIIPKSMAPRLIKLASIPKIYIIERAKSKLSGMTEAMTNPERMLPKSSTTTKMTIRQPRMRFSATVAVVFLMRALRSRKPLMWMPSGRLTEISATLSFTSLITWLELASLSIIT